MAADNESPGSIDAAQSSATAAGMLKVARHIGGNGIDNLFRILEKNASYTGIGELTLRFGAGKKSRIVMEFDNFHWVVRRAIFQDGDQNLGLLAPHPAESDTPRQSFDADQQRELAERLRGLPAPNPGDLQEDTLRAEYFRELAAPQPVAPPAKYGKPSRQGNGTDETTEMNRVILQTNK